MKVLFQRVIGTPHVGGLTGDMFYRSGELFAGNLRRWAGRRGAAVGGQRPAITSRAGSGILEAWLTISA